MQQFYVSQEDSSSASNSNLNNVNNTCVVCQESPVTRAMLPCRHACVCARCFTRLRDRCPMCRAHVREET
jgi:hypothetical protein